nr:DinB family protein [Mucilaginibacter achroorhodeus]
MDRAEKGFLESFKQSLNLSLTLEKGQGVILNLSPLELFTHVITHEFHHKGQLVNMSRQLGYIPVDTDVIRT